MVLDSLENHTKILRFIGKYGLTGLTIYPYKGPWDLLQNTVHDLTIFGRRTPMDATSGDVEATNHDLQLTIVHHSSFLYTIISYNFLVVTCASRITAHRFQKNGGR